MFRRTRGIKIGKRPRVCPPLASHHLEGFSFRDPNDLSVSTTGLRRILVIGSCLSEWLKATVPQWAPGCGVDFLLFNHFAELPDNPPRPAEEYDFQIVQLPLRFVMEETIYFGLPWSDERAWMEFFDRSCRVLHANLESALRYSESLGLLTFVTNFVTPQQNPMGRLLPRDDLRNLVYFVERLNGELRTVVEQMSGVHVLDVDQIASSCGRRYIQDDLLFHSSHGALLDTSVHERDAARIEPPKSLDTYYTLQTELFMREMWNEAVALYRTVRQIDQVKLVIVDLDDTLWRGVVAEQDEITDDTTEGWPLGMAEALSFLKKRGVLLAVVSKNDEDRVAALWPPNLKKCLSLDDFAVRKINWVPKVENVESVLSEVNLLPRSVVYIDDNPVERAAVKGSFPDVRVLGSDLYSIRRVLLWSPETQVVAVTEESGRRTEMVQAQTRREALRSRVSREDFLAELQVMVEIGEIRDVADRRMVRALELVNKSNQFNTTGRRHTMESMCSLLDSGGHLAVFSVEDRYTSYGIVGVAMLVPSKEQLEIAQFVMSCRVFGLDVEMAVVSELMRKWDSDGGMTMCGRFEKSDANAPSEDLYVRAGYSQVQDGIWERPCIEFGAVMPDHVTVVA